MTDLRLGLNCDVLRCAMGNQSSGALIVVMPLIVLFFRSDPNSGTIRP